MRIFPRRRKRNTLGDMASAAIANSDMPSAEPTSGKQHGSVSAQEFLKQWIVTLAGCVIGHCMCYSVLRVNLENTLQMNPRHDAPILNSFSNCTQPVAFFSGQCSRLLRYHG